MKTNHAAAKNRRNGKPVEVVKEGSIAVPIYRHTNIVPQRDAAGKIIYGPPDANGKPKALVKYQSDIFTVIYYEGRKRVREKFSDVEKAKRRAGEVAIKIANGETEALKLTGGDRADYVRAMQKLREWKPDADLNVCVADYLAAVRRLPEHTSLKEAVDFYVKRHPIGLPPKTVQEVVDELIESKTRAGKSEIYLRELNRRLGKFAAAFQVRIATITGRQIEDHIRALGGAGRTQNNVRQLLNTLFKFAIKRGYLPKDHDEMSAVERAAVDDGEIEVFTPDELRKLFAACVTPVQERGKWRTREDMIPYLAIGAFCGLRAAEIERLDWSEIHLTGPERFIEVKAGKSKTASRRTVPISDNCAAWLARFAEPSGPIVTLARTDKQLFLYLARKSGVPWKHNGLRHSFISYRLALIKDVGQVSLEAGNSPQMIFKHYRQLVRESEANQWFAIVPPKQAGADIIPMPARPLELQTTPLAAPEFTPAAIANT